MCLRVVVHSAHSLVARAINTHSQKCSVRPRSAAERPPARRLLYQAARPARAGFYAVQQRQTRLKT
jgi:hypothetical protein